MPLIRLRGPLKQRAGGCAEHAVQAATVREALRALESAQPELRGWILDERGLVRRHINVFVDGRRTRLDTALAPGADVYVLTAVSGG